MGTLKSKISKTLLENAAKEANGNVRKAAMLLTDALGETVSTELMRYYLRDIDYKKYKVKPEEPRILIFDIETAPMQVYTWGLFQQDIPITAIIKDWYVLCWSAKWLGENKILHDALYLHEDYVSGDDCEYNVIESIWTLLDSCDIAVAHNGKSFDKKKLNSKFLEYGFPEPVYKIVDTKLIAKGNFAMSSNKLDFISKKFGNEGKISTDFSLWKGCMAGNTEKFKQMVEYCDNDVIELERVYTTLRPWDKNHPNYGQYLDTNKVVCNICGSEKLDYIKDIHTGVSTYEVFQCTDCGGNSRSRKAVKKTETRINI